MLPRHQKIMELALAGHGVKEIAQAVGMTAQGIGLIMRAPIFQQAIAQRRDRREKRVDEDLSEALTKAKDVIEDAAVGAAETQVSLLEAEDDTVRLASSKAILDRAFGDVDKKSGGSGAQTIVLAPGSVQLLHIALQESDDARKPISE